MATSYLDSGIRTNNTTVREADGIVRCTLHQTIIATWNRSAGTVELNTGGWNTPTTIRRMNECLFHWGFKARVCKSDFASTRTMLINGGGSFRGVAVLTPSTWSTLEEAAARRALLRAGVPSSELTITRGACTEPCVDALSPEGCESVLARVLAGDPIGSAS